MLDTIITNSNSVTNIKYLTLNIKTNISLEVFKKLDIAKMLFHFCKRYKLLRIITAHTEFLLSVRRTNASPLPLYNICLIRHKS